MSWQPPCQEGVCPILFFHPERAAELSGVHICHGSPQCTFWKLRTHLDDTGPQISTTPLSILSDIKAYESEKQRFTCPYLLVYTPEVTPKEVRFEGRVDVCRLSPTQWGRCPKT